MKGPDRCFGYDERTMLPYTMNDRWSKLGAGLRLVCLLFILHFRCEAQNLVPNPGFEETDTCTFGLGLGALHNWHSAYLTPDHLQSCHPYGTANGLPLNMFTYQQPYEGNSCVGIYTYLDVSGQEQREWVMVHLLDTLVPGQAYTCSFWANPAFGGNDLHPQIWLASNHVGMLFTTYDRHWTAGDPYPTALNYAHIENPQILSDTVAWSLVSGSFVADSAYTYLMVGNFFSNTLTDTVHFADPGSVFPWYPFGYTLIDGVCVSPNPVGCDLSHGIVETGNQQGYVYPIPAIDALVIGHVSGRDVVVLDMMGRHVWDGKVNDDPYTLGVGDWPRGAYVLQIRGSSVVEVVKFVLAQ